ncbi:hypothetical protein [Paenibacillus sp. GYB003]
MDVGMRLPNPKHPQKAELAFGFASDFAPKRLANVYALDRLLPDAALGR